MRLKETFLKNVITSYILDKADKIWVRACTKSKKNRRTEILFGSTKSTEVFNHANHFSKELDNIKKVGFEKKNQIFLR